MSNYTQRLKENYFKKNNYSIFKDQLMGYTWNWKCVLLKYHMIRHSLIKHDSIQFTSVQPFCPQGKIVIGAMRKKKHKSTNKRE